VAGTADPAGLPPSALDPAQGATGRAGGGVLARVAALHEELARAYRQLEIELAGVRETRLMSDVETTTSPARLLTAADLGEMLQVDARTIRSWRKRGAIPAGIEIAGVIRWRPEEIDAWLAAGGRP
jgi:predicted DNA-binding transcriptional regulator AlpA